MNGSVFHTHTLPIVCDDHIHMYMCNNVTLNVNIFCMTKFVKHDVNRSVLCAHFKHFETCSSSSRRIDIFIFFSNKTSKPPNKQTTFFSLQRESRQQVDLCNNSRVCCIRCRLLHEHSLSRRTLFCYATNIECILSCPQHHHINLSKNKLFSEVTSQIG